MEPIRIANCSGFFGDRASAAREMVEGGPIDVLTGDYLAELTMAILARYRLRDPAAGYVPTLLSQLEDVLAACVDRGIKVVANAGGLNPAALASEVEALAARQGVALSVATVTGDDVLDRVGELRHLVDGTALDTERGQPLTASAYLGGWGIADALTRGADIVLTGRVADASLVVGPSAWWHDWGRDDWNALAGAVVAGHVIECGAQATGGNYSFFAEVPDLLAPGFPIAEVAADGSSVITKHPGSGGLVSAGTVTAQLLYEVGGPAYVNPDVVAHLDTVRLDDLGDDRVAISGVVGTPPPATTKVSTTLLSGFHNSVTFVLPGLDIEAKAALAEEALWRRVGGKEQYETVDVQLLRTEHDDPASHEASFAYLKVSVADTDAAKVGRAFSNAAIELALASYPGFLVTAPPTSERPRIVYWPGVIDQPEALVTVNGTSVGVPPTMAAEDPPAELDTDQRIAEVPAGSTVDIPLGRIVGARSGDKGGDANVGVWARSDESFAWLERFLSVERLKELVPEARPLRVDRYSLPKLRALNFVLHGYLGEGVSSSPKWDPQAKALGEYLRARVVPVPEVLVAS
jgi:hypothetical protein